MRALIVKWPPEAPPPCPACGSAETRTEPNRVFRFDGIAYRSVRRSCDSCGWRKSTPQLVTEPDPNP